MYQEDTVWPFTPRAKDVNIGGMKIAPTCTLASSASTHPIQPSDVDRTRQNITSQLPLPQQHQTNQTPAKQRKLSEEGNDKEDTISKKIYSTVNVERLAELLEGFPLKDYVVNGFTYGFRINFEGTEEPLECDNSQSAKENPEAVEKKLQKEIREGRMAGPFKDPPFENFKCFPLAVRPKSVPGEYRLLHNLSYPYDHRSVNKSIPKEHTKCKYATIQDAMELVNKVGQGCYLAKADIKSAFRIVPIHPDNYHLMGSIWKGQYYYDKFLAMGLAESCKIFEIVSDALVYILRSHYHVINVVKIIDDFLFIEVNKGMCMASLNTFVRLCEELGIPVAYDKTSKDGDTVIIFLGTTIDSDRMEARLPLDKLQLYSSQIEEALHKTRITVKELRNLLGRLQFATSVIPSGRPFLRRLYDLLKPEDKPYWHKRLTEGTKKDLRVFYSFLKEYNGVTILRQPPIVESNAINLYSDASSYGYAGTYGSSWLQGKWPKSWVDKTEGNMLNIAVLELYPILLILLTFASKLSSSAILFHCDNMSIVHVINSQTSKDPNIMALLRPLILTLLQHNIRFKAVHITSEDNVLADRISRFQETPQLLDMYGMKRVPNTTPQCHAPTSFIP